MVCSIQVRTRDVSFVHRICQRFEFKYLDNVIIFHNFKCIEVAVAAAEEDLAGCLFRILAQFGEILQRGSTDSLCYKGFILKQRMMCYSKFLVGLSCYGSEWSTNPYQAQCRSLSLSCDLSTATACTNPGGFALGDLDINVPLSMPDGFISSPSLETLACEAKPPIYLQAILSFNFYVAPFVVTLKNIITIFSLEPDIHLHYQYGSSVSQVYSNSLLSYCTGSCS